MSTLILVLITHIKYNKYYYIFIVPTISRLFQSKLLWIQTDLHVSFVQKRLRQRLKKHLANDFAKVHPWEWQLSKEWYQTRLKLPALSQVNFASPIHPRTTRWFQNHHSSPGTSMVLSILNLVGIWNRSPDQKPEHWLLPHLQSWVLVSLENHSLVLLPLLVLALWDPSKAFPKVQQGASNLHPPPGYARGMEEWYEECG